jgi:Domain of unknown function (DUF4160)
MPTILRIGRLRILMYVNDHPPPPVRAIKTGAEARIAIGSGDRKTSLLSNDGLSRRELAVALEAVDRHRPLLLMRWRELHGDA